MPVELRKRKAPAAPAPTPAPKKTTKAKAAVDKAKATVTGKTAEPKTEEKKEEAEPVAAPVEKAKKVEVGDTVTLEGFGGEVETNDGEKTSLKKLVDESGSGVVLFTYPKASTPGCESRPYPITNHFALGTDGTTGTTQVCLFRDAYTPLTADGLAIYGLSTDSPKANTTFKTKQSLPYPLLCDPQATLIDAIGLKKTPKGTQRGVFVVDKAGKVLVAEAGGPAKTVERVQELVAELKK